MGTGNNPENGSGDDSSDEGIRDATEKDLLAIQTDFDNMCRRETKFLTRAGTVCDELSAVIVEAESTAVLLHTTLAKLPGALHDLDGVYTGIAEHADRVRHI